MLIVMPHGICIVINAPAPVYRGFSFCPFLINIRYLILMLVK